MHENKKTSNRNYSRLNQNNCRKQRNLILSLTKNVKIGGVRESVFADGQGLCRQRVAGDANS